MQSRWASVIDENPIDRRRQQHSAVALPWCDDGDALDQRHALGRGPLAEDHEADRHWTVDTDKIGMTVVEKGLTMMRFVPAPDKGVIARTPFGRHDEGQVIFGSA